MSELIALLEGREVGRVVQKSGRLRFEYSASWQEAPGSYPLSLSMPLAGTEYGHATIEPFLWGLLPDNEIVLRRWAKDFQVSARNPFSLIAHVGMDCAGAVQFVKDENLEEALSQHSGGVDWLTEEEVAERLRDLDADEGAWRRSGDTGQFSLAGAQPKTALLFDGQRWGVPHGRVPTTHIIKPPSGELPGHAENEHLCLSLARALGIPTAHSQVQQFEGVTAIVVERYDRVRVTELAASKAAEAAMYAASPEEPEAIARVARATADARALSELAKTSPVYRAHQEDFCQALSVYPERKYQNEGGPGPRQIIELLRAHASAGRKEKTADRSIAHDEDVATFIDALIFNWLVGGTDAHAKNYSVLIGGDGLVRLAPLYDVASLLAYPKEDAQKAKLAMKVGGKYRLRDIGIREWEKFAREMRIDSDMLIDRVRAMASELPDRLMDEIKHMHSENLSHPVIDTLAKVLPVRAAKFASK